MGAAKTADVPRASALALPGGRGGLNERILTLWARVLEGGNRLKD